MGVLTDEHPKCMTEVSPRETILSRQLRMLSEVGVSEAIITTGYYDSILIRYCQSLDLPLKYTFVKNELYDETNYIYSIYCARDYLDDDILLLHGDLVFENEVLDKVIEANGSVMTVSTTLPLPDKDFKAVVHDGKIISVGVDFFNEACSAQPLYKLSKESLRAWLDVIIRFCESGNVDDRKVYAENALNRLNGSADINALDVRDLLCAEIDNASDLAIVTDKLEKVESRTVYMCFSTDVIHGGHISIIRKAQRLGRVIAGVLSDEAVASYKRYPLLPFSERKAMIESISGIYRVVEQKRLSYRDILEELKPDFVVHGNDWREGFQKPIRDEVTDVLSSYGGKLVEFPYTASDKYRDLEIRERADLAMPDIRRGRLRKELDMTGFVTVMEAHDGLTGLIVEDTVIYQEGAARQYDAMWVSSLCDSTAKGKPDIELVDMTSRFRTIEDILEVTTKPIIFDGDTGGKTEHFVYTVRSLERLGVSMVIIEDKTGLKKNSLFGTEVEQSQASIESFCAKIAAGKKAQKTGEFIICARIESLILEKGMEDALTRARAYVSAGADAIMIHSRKKEPDEIFEFIEEFRREDKVTPIVLVPTSFNSIKEEEWKKRGANVIIYANQLMRATVPAIKKAAETILINHRGQECDDMLMPFSEIIRMIPEE